MAHDSSEIIEICWFAAQETCLIIINVENSYFLETAIIFRMSLQMSLLSPLINLMHSIWIKTLISLKKKKKNLT